MCCTLFSTFFFFFLIICYFFLTWGKISFFFNIVSAVKSFWYKAILVFFCFLFLLVIWCLGFFSETNNVGFSHPASPCEKLWDISNIRMLVKILFLSCMPVDHKTNNSSKKKPSRHTQTNFQSNRSILPLSSILCVCWPHRFDVPGPWLVIPYFTMFLFSLTWGTVCIMEELTFTSSVI